MSDMEKTAVNVEKLGPVTVVTLDRPDVRNAVDADTAQALYRAFVDFDGDADARVAVFHGANGHFCAGWDLQFGAALAAGISNPATGARSGPWGRAGFCCRSP
jgi:enoyl-CoA hydratase